MSTMQKIKAFIKSNANHTQKALAVTLIAIDHMLEHRDWDGCAVMISQTDAKMGSQIRSIIRETVGGITMSKDEKHHTGMRFKLGDNFAGTDKLEVLRKLVKENKTLYCKEVQEGLLAKEPTEAKEKTMEEVSNHIVNYLEKHGFALSGKIVKAENTSQRKVPAEPAH